MRGGGGGEEGEEGRPNIAKEGVDSGAEEEGEEGGWRSDHHLYMHARILHVRTRYSCVLWGGG